MPILLALLLAAAIGAGHALPVAAPVRAPQRSYTYYLFSIEVTGTKRLTAQQVIALSGLKTGRSVQAKDLEAARARLADSGLFASVAYRVRTAGGGYSVSIIFSIQDAVWQAPVLFDNFVGLSDAQLKNAVSAAVPTFDGFVPQSTAALERVRDALENLARDSGQPGTVTYLLVDDVVLGLRRYRFHLDRASGPVRVCRIALQTRADALREEMTGLTRAIVATDYSYDYVVRHAMSNLLPVERRAGFLRARVGDVTASRESAEGCDGVRVTIAMEDGVQYRWRSSTWSGNARFTSAELDRLLGIAAGDAADGTKLERGLRAITDAYRRNGYLQAVIQSDRTFDDTGATVACTFRVVEGGQFRMGKLEIAGLEPAVVEQLKGLWQIPEGEVFDASYVSRFIADARGKLRAALAPFKATDIRTTPDRTALTVDVLLTFRSSEPRASAPAPSFPAPAGSRP